MHADNITASADPRIDRFARLLTDYCLRAGADDAVSIAATPLAAPLVNAVYARLLRRGAHAFPRLTLDGMTEAFYARARAAHLDRVHPLERAEARLLNRRLVIQSAYNPRAAAAAPADRVARFLRSRAPLRHLWKKNPWCLTLFPTPAYAREAGMSPRAFADFVFAAVFADQADPAAAWRRVKAEQDRLIRRLAGADRVHLRARDTDLTFRIKGRPFVNCHGRTNMPDGEVFCAPLEHTVSGHIRYTYPVLYQGREVADVLLRFRDGKIVEARAARDEAFLNRVLDMDAGARYLGEFGIGTNRRIQRFTKNILFDEKIGGTIHLAAGDGGNNRSALHWDMICDLRDGGEIRIDGALFQKDGQFVN